LKPIWDTLLYLGNAHSQLGNYNEQKSSLERALIILESHFGTDHPQVAIALIYLGNAHGKLGNYNEME
jgi:tetratricopeptide (TPR) repeat protein